MLIPEAFVGMRLACGNEEYGALEPLLKSRAVSVRQSSNCGER